MSYLTPIVIEKSGKGERAYDIWSRLLKDRIVFIGGPIDDYVANLIIAQLLFLQSESKTQDIELYINSPGGSVTAGLAIYDTMQYIQCDVAAYCIGQASSMGAVLLAAGTKGKRSCLPHARVMIHQPLGGFEGQATDIEIHAREILKMRERLNEILCKHSLQSIDRISKDTDRDFYMDAAEAKTYGIVDQIIKSKNGSPPAARRAESKIHRELLTS